MACFFRRRKKERKVYNAGYWKALLSDSHENSTGCYKFHNSHFVHFNIIFFSLVVVVVVASILFFSELTLNLNYFVFIQMFHYEYNFFFYFSGGGFCRFLLYSITSLPTGLFFIPFYYGTIFSIFVVVVVLLLCFTLFMAPSDCENPIIKIWLMWKAFVTEGKVA